MIVILMRYHGHTLQGAMDYIRDLCKRTIDDFNDHRKKIPSWEPEVDDMVQRYVEGLQNWIVG
jgi:alpha-muurolene/germacrene-A/gamma-muurolene synthase